MVMLQKLHKKYHHITQITLHEAICIRIFREFSFLLSYDVWVGLYFIFIGL
ncbi:MAG: hypothetical protein ACKPKO_56835 [Candidatus Fonsibacter sp.]